MADTKIDLIAYIEFRREDVSLEHHADFDNSDKWWTSFFLKRLSNKELLKRDIKELNPLFDDLELEEAVLYYMGNLKSADNFIIEFGERQNRVSYFRATLKK